MKYLLALELRVSVAILLFEKMNQKEICIQISDTKFSYKITQTSQMKFKEKKLVFNFFFYLVISIF